MSAEPVLRTEIPYIRHKSQSHVVVSSAFRATAIYNSIREISTISVIIEIIDVVSIKPPPFYANGSSISGASP